MVLEIFSVYDKKTQVYGRPFYAHNKGHAVRMVSDEARNTDSQLYCHSADFVLCRIGKFDDGHGVIEPVKLENVMEVSELVKRGDSDE